MKPNNESIEPKLRKLIIQLYFSVIYINFTLFEVIFILLSVFTNTRPRNFPTYFHHSQFTLSEMNYSLSSTALLFYWTVPVLSGSMSSSLKLLISTAHRKRIIRTVKLTSIVRQGNTVWKNGKLAKAATATCCILYTSNYSYQLKFI